MKIFKEKRTDTYDDPEEWSTFSEFWIELHYPRGCRYLLETKVSPYKNQLTWNRYIIKL